MTRRPAPPGVGEAYGVVVAEDADADFGVGFDEVLALVDVELDVAVVEAVEDGEVFPAAYGLAVEEDLAFHTARDDRDAVFDVAGGDDEDELALELGGGGDDEHRGVTQAVVHGEGLVALEELGDGEGVVGVPGADRERQVAHEDRCVARVEEGGGRLRGRRGSTAARCRRRGRPRGRRRGGPRRCRLWMGAARRRSGCPTPGGATAGAPCGRRSRRWRRAARLWPGCRRIRRPVRWR